MNTQEMFKEVDRRVSLVFVEHLLPKAISRHANTADPDCNCKHCRIKRRAKSDIANVRVPAGCKLPPLRYTVDSYESWEIGRERREALKTWYRDQLARCINE